MLRANAQISNNSLGPPPPHGSAMTRMLLTQCEAAFLLSPRADTAPDCIRATMLALIAQGRMAIREGVAASRTFEVVLGSDNGPEGLAEHQRVVESTLRERRGGGRLSASDVHSALSSKFGLSFRRYVHDHVAPSLIASGHVVRIDGKWLGLFPRIRYELTPRGMAAIEPLKRRLADLDDLPALLKSDPDRALRLAHEAGVILVLSPIARRQLPRLRRLMAEREADGGYTPLTGMPPAGTDTGFETAEWPLDPVDCGLLDAVWSVCDATTGDTGSADGGGSDSGGDGGGGDGGGGGGGD